jgi:hypothetical protein
MDSTGSCTSSTAPAADSSLQSLAIHDKGAKLGQQKRPASSRAPPSASKKKAPEMNAEFEFKCDHCPRSFPTAQGCGGHQKAHRHLVKLLRRQIKKSSGSSGRFNCKFCPAAYPTARGLVGHLKKAHKGQQDGHRRLPPAGPQVRVSPSLSLAPAWEALTSTFTRSCSTRIARACTTTLAPADLASCLCSPAPAPAALLPLNHHQRRLEVEVMLEAVVMSESRDK